MLTVFLPSLSVLAFFRTMGYLAKLTCIKHPFEQPITIPEESYAIPEKTR